MLLGTCLRHATAYCSAGFFKPDWAQECLPCAAGTWSVNYNTLKTCDICPGNTYSGWEAGSCTECPTGTSSDRTSSPSIFSCDCDIGYYEANPDRRQPNACAKCSVGSFNADKMNAETCVNCDVGYIANSERTACPTPCPSGETTDGEGGDCQCIYPKTRAYVPVYRCVSRYCAAGTYVEGWNCEGCDVTCQDCAVGTHGKTDWNQDGDCTPCVEGSYQPDTGQSSCVGCPLHMTSAMGSDEKEDCVCVDGYIPQSALITTGDSACILCQPGTYKKEYDCDGCHVNSYCINGTARDCPAYSTSAAWSYAKEHCVCDAGRIQTPAEEEFCTMCGLGMYKTEGGSCETCPANAYCINGIVYSCPSNSQSPAGSHSITDCVCAVGYHHVA